MESRGNDFTFFWASKNPHLFAKSSLQHLQTQWDKSRPQAIKERDLNLFATLPAPAKYMRLNNTSTYSSNPAFRNSAPAGSFGQVNGDGGGARYDGGNNQNQFAQSWNGGYNHGGGGGRELPRAITPSKLFYPRSSSRPQLASTQYPSNPHHPHDYNHSMGRKPYPMNKHNTNKIAPLPSSSVHAHATTHTRHELPAPRYHW